jgi:hypothetical protein
MKVITQLKIFILYITIEFTRSTTYLPLLVDQVTPLMVLISQL